MQSKKHSLIESLTNVAIGYLVAVGSQIVIFPFFGIHIPIHQNFLMGLWFTVISIVRSYIIRRWFTKRTEIPKLWNHPDAGRYHLTVDEREILDRVSIDDLPPKV